MFYRFIQGGYSLSVTFFGGIIVYAILWNFLVNFTIYFTPVHNLLINGPLLIPVGIFCGFSVLYAALLIAIWNSAKWDQSSSILRFIARFTLVFGLALPGRMLTIVEEVFFPYPSLIINQLMLFVYFASLLYFYRLGKLS